MKNNAFITLAACACLASASHIAQADEVKGQQKGMSLSAMAGYMGFDEDLQAEDGVFGSVGVGYQFSSNWGVELSYLMGDSEFENGTEFDSDILRFDALYHFAQSERVRPYVLLGVGHQSTEWNDLTADNSVVNAGLGLKIAISDVLSLRPEIRHIHDTDYKMGHQTVGLGLNLQFGKTSSAPIKPREQAPLPPKDSDQDGVNNDLDQCPATPAGRPVDMNGCEVSVDSDGDGIVDSLDQCPDTSAGAKVDSKGCYIVITETKEVSLKVQFENNSAKVAQASYPEIEQVAQFMREYPLTEVVIEGHTDDTGPAAYNLKLSQQRAQAVADVLVQAFSIEAQRVSARGYGEDQPLVENSSAVNRAINRRVTAKVSAQVESIDK